MKEETNSFQLDDFVENNNSKIDIDDLIKRIDEKIEELEQEENLSPKRVSVLEQFKVEE